MNELIASGSIAGRIYFIRGKYVMLDRDLAELYRVPTKVLNQAAKRHHRRFPKDFMIQLNPVELQNWRCQFGSSNSSVKMGLRYRPYAFTSLGVAMLSSVLNSARAIQVNMAIMRVFDRMRELIAEDRALGSLVAEHEHRLDGHDHELAKLMEEIPKLAPPAGASTEPKPVIGFTPAAKGKWKRPG